MLIFGSSVEGDTLLTEEVEGEFVVTIIEEGMEVTV